MGSCFSSSREASKIRHTQQVANYNTASNVSRVGYTYSIDTFSSISNKIQGENRASAGPRQKLPLKPPWTLDLGSSFYNSFSSATAASCTIEETHQGAPRTFPQFWALPKELRLMIAAEYIKAYESRTIAIYCTTRNQRPLNPDQTAGSIEPARTSLSPQTAAEATKQFESATFENLPPTWPWQLRTTKCSVPAALQVNTEFRHEAQKVYKLSFGRQLGGRPQWFDFEKDVLFMGSGGAYDLFRWGIRNNQSDHDAIEEVERQLRHLALGNLRYSDVADFCSSAHIFRRLRVIYVEQRCPSWSRLVHHWFQRLREAIETNCDGTSRPDEANTAPEILTIGYWEFQRRLGLPKDMAVVRAEIGEPQIALTSPSPNEIQALRSRERFKHVDCILQLNQREISRINCQIRQFRAELDV
jgi:2EXR family